MQEIFISHSEQYPKHVVFSWAQNTFKRTKGKEVNVKYYNFLLA